MKPRNDARISSHSGIARSSLPPPKGVVPVSSTQLVKWIKRLDALIASASALRAEIQHELDEYRKG